MRISVILMASLLVVGVLAVEGVATNLGVDEILTSNAAASCVEDPATGACVPVPCPSQLFAACVL